MRLLIKAKGSSSSGNYGHKGRKGQVGGSSPRGSSLDYSTYRTVSGKEFREWVAPWNKVHDDEQMHLNYYSGDAYMDMNPKLRKGEELWNMEGTRAWEMYWGIKNGIGSSRLPEDVIVFKGYTSNPFKGVKPGDQVQDNAFLSTSVSRNAALGFTSEDNNGERHIAKIYAPEGTSAAPMVHATDAEGNVRFEGELIFSDRKKMVYRGSHTEIINEGGREITIRVHELEMPRPPSLRDIAKKYGDAGQAAIGRRNNVIGWEEFVERGGRKPLFEFNQEYERWQSKYEHKPVLSFDYPNPY